MGRFNRLTRATLPIIRDEALVFPTAVPPPPATVDSAPAGFAPYMIRPEVLGAPVTPSVPGMFDQRTLLSIFPSLTAAASVAPSPIPPPPVEPLAPPSPVIDIFNSHAVDKADSAVEMDYAANLQTSIAESLQRQADEAAFKASEAAATATVDPSFYAQADAAAAAARADDAQYEANLAIDKAAVINQKADEKVAEASEAAQRLEQAMLQEQEQYAASVYEADTTALEDAFSTPGFAPQLYRPVDVPAFSVSPLMAGGALGVIGYLLGGARGAAVGALLGGAGVHFLGR